MIGARELAGLLGRLAPTDEQVAVIEAPLAPTLVVAGAGSGKTETMAARVVYLIANGLVRPEQVLGLTFTRKASAELAKRIRSRLHALISLELPAGIADEVAAAEPEIFTYHGFGGRIISEFGPLDGLQPQAKVLTATGAWQLARRVVGRWDGDLRTDLSADRVTEDVLDIGGALADHLSTPAALSQVLGELLAVIDGAARSPQQRNPIHSGLAGQVKRLTDRIAVLPLVDGFEAAKRATGVVDFADQMQLAARLVGEHSRIGAVLRDRFRVVMLDEYQDTGHAQRIILRALFGAGGHPVTAVGDPVQSIYGWRGASASNLPRFATDFPNADGSPAAQLTLLTSFRNPRRVLALANAVSDPVRAAPVAVGSLQPGPVAMAGNVRCAVLTTTFDEDDWVAETIAGLWSASPADRPPTTAVLLRRRADMAGISAALRERGLPVEVVGIGGLLDEPEVADLVAMVRVLVDHDAGAATVRLLTGTRWRLGLADLAALTRRARALGPRSAGGTGPHGADADDGGTPASSSAAQVRAALTEAAVGEDVDTAGLVDALADPGSATDYSTDGYRRITRLGTELRRLRGHLGLPLPELVGEVERVLGLDIEATLASSSGRAHLDAFAEVVADIAADGAGPVELLDHLAAAADREDGLAPGDLEAVAGRVQVLTVHAAKGLEWEIVAVAHLCEGVFPGSKTSTWLGDASRLPSQIRGDRDDLPDLVLPPDGDQKDIAKALSAHASALKQAQQAEERRLMYVALTRAEQTLLLSAHRWAPGVAHPRPVSSFLAELIGEPALGEPEIWTEEPADDELNPLAVEPRVGTWPLDPLGSRRPAVAAGAELVRRAMTTIGPAESGTDGSAGAGSGGWSRDVDLLLAERAASGRGAVIDVPLPETLSVSALVDLAHDPEQLARRLRRPIPMAPAPSARRGTAFHAWLERHFGGGALVDIQDLPGADERDIQPDNRIEELREAFLASRWADRIPLEVEVPFATRVDGIHLRGRIDAVFADPDGGYTVVDWKTGRPPGPAQARSAAVQLAAYRLAWAQLSGTPLGRVRAAFHYVSTGDTIAPVDLLDEDGLADLIRTASSLGDPVPVGESPVSSELSNGRTPVRAAGGAGSPRAASLGPRTHSGAGRASGSGARPQLRSGPPAVLPGLSDPTGPTGGSTRR